MQAVNLLLSCGRQAVHQSDTSAIFTRTGHVCSLLATFVRSYGKRNVAKLKRTQSKLSILDRHVITDARLCRPRKSRVTNSCSVR